MIITTSATTTGQFSKVGMCVKYWSRIFQAGCLSCHPTNSVKALKGLTTDENVNKATDAVKLCKPVIMTPSPRRGH